MAQIEVSSEGFLQYLIHFHFSALQVHLNSEKQKSEEFYEKSRALQQNLLEAQTTNAALEGQLSGK